MKKRTMYILCLSAVVTVCTFKAFAASYHEPIQVEGPTINVDADSEVQAQQYVDFKFKGLKNSQHIILVKGGGYLLNEDGSDVDKSDLQDGDRIITVKQAKEIEKASYLEDEDNLKIFLNVTAPKDVVDRQNEELYRKKRGPKPQPSELLVGLLNEANSL